VRGISCAPQNFRRSLVNAAGWRYGPRRVCVCVREKPYRVCVSTDLSLPLHSGHTSKMSEVLARSDGSVRNACSLAWLSEKALLQLTLAHVATHALRIYFHRLSIYEGLANERHKWVVKSSTTEK